MSAEADVRETTKSIELTAEQMRAMSPYIKNRQAHYLAQTAVNTMHYGVERFWQKHYNLQSGQTRQLALFQGGGDTTWEIAKRKYKGRRVLEPSQNSKNFRSRNGNKRLVSFSFGGVKTIGDFITAKSIFIHSFPMNWYERDVMLRGWASVDGKIRRGTHIMKGYMQPYAEAELYKAMIPFRSDVVRRWNEMH